MILLVCTWLSDICSERKIEIENQAVSFVRSFSPPPPKYATDFTGNKAHGVRYEGWIGMDRVLGLRVTDRYNEGKKQE